MNTFHRLVAIAVLALFFVQSAPLFDPIVFAGPVPAGASQEKKKKKTKKRKLKILKGRHGKRHGKPA
jgi:hypothetical protein